MSSGLKDAAYSTREVDNLGVQGPGELFRTDSCAPPTPRGPYQKSKEARRGQTRGKRSKAGGDEGEGHPQGRTHQGRSSTAQGRLPAGMTAGATAGSARLSGGRQRPQPWRWVKTALGGPRPAGKVCPPLRSDPGNPPQKDCRTAAQRDDSSACASLTSLPLRHVDVRDWSRSVPPLAPHLLVGGTRQGAVVSVRRLPADLYCLRCPSEFPNECSGRFVQCKVAKVLEVKNFLKGKLRKVI